MVSAYTIQCVGAGGRPFTITGYLGVDAAAGVYMNLDLNKPATATSPDNVVIPRGGCVITDLIATVTGIAPLEGQIEIVAGGQGTQNFVDVASRGPTNPGRTLLSIPLQGGTQLMVAVVTAINDV